MPPEDDGAAFRLLAQSLSDYAIYMLDPDGFVRTWNAGAARIKGYEPAEIIGQHFSRFFTEDDRRQGLPEKALQIARTTGRYESEGWRLRKDGRRFWVAAVLEAIKDENGTLIGFGKVTRDITERYEQRMALIESERRFRLLIDSVVDYAIFMLDPSGIITNWNTGAERIKGYPASEAVGAHFSKFYTRQERARGLPAVALETAKRDGKYETEGWRVRKDGGHFWASVVIEPVRAETGQLIGYAKITRDITERRVAQEALKESERQFRLLVSAVIDYAIYMLDPNGVVVSWNAGANKIKGYAADEIIGSHFSRFYPEEDRQAGAPARALYAATSEGRFEGEGWRVRKDGTRFWASVVIDAIRDEDGVLVGFAKITRDITERKEAQSALERAQRQLAESQKMEALGQLTGGIAHDFNNLLTIVGGQARIIGRSASDQKTIKAVEAIELTVQRGASLTRQLLGFARRQQLEPQPIELGERLGGLQAMLATSMPPNLSLVCSIPPSTSAVIADPNEFDLAIMNLVLNARDASREGAITIAAEDQDTSQDSLGRQVQGSYVAISVSDNGVGIPSELLARVFDPFFTTKAAGKGTGLGLSQVYGFAEQSGGSVSIDSEPGEGTRVTITLPAAKASDRPSSAPRTESLPRRDARVLMVEDNLDVIEASAALIKDLGYSIRLASDAQTALRALDEEEVDIVFSDIMMPGDMDGLQMARAIRRKRPALPILLASGSLQLLEAARRDFAAIQKPYDIAQLDETIQRLLAGGEQREGAQLVDLQSVKEQRGKLGKWNGGV